MRDHQDEFDTLRVAIKLVAFDADYLATAYARATRLDWPILIDSDRSLYRGYGIGKGSWWSLYGVPSIWKYLKLIFQGHRPGRPGRDWSQLGGDVLIDPQGIVRMHRISTSPHDRPRPEEILDMIRPTESG